ncbi:MAG: hypothetical protein IPO81_31945 [Kouleothrix sp.]|nr:hypothetical protein [Kouleothrix sp.]
MSGWGGGVGLASAGVGEPAAAVGWLVAGAIGAAAGARLQPTSARTQAAPRRAEQQTCSSTGPGADAAQAPRIDLRPRRLRGAARQSAAAQSP